MMNALTTRSVRTRLLFTKAFGLLPFCAILLASTANALPGQRVEAVSSWIASHPTLQPGISDGLMVRKSDSPARRFTFQASVLPPGQVSFPENRGIVRSERISLYDTINGVTPERLEESLRAIYGPEIHQDYRRALPIYTYPTSEDIDRARRQNRPLLEAQQGELLVGDRYAYWLEVTKNENGKAFTGELTIFLKDDLEKVETELRAR